MWHVRLGHVSFTYLEKAAKLIPELKGIKFIKDSVKCETCTQAKQHKNPSNTERYYYDTPLRLIHTDTMMMNPPTLYKGSKYVVTFLDDYTRYAWA